MPFYLPVVPNDVRDKFDVLIQELMPKSRLFPIYVDVSGDDTPKDEIAHKDQCTSQEGHIPERTPSPKTPIAASHLRGRGKKK